MSVECETIEKLISRSLLIWHNFILELRDEERIRFQWLDDALEPIRERLPEINQEIAPDDLWKEVNREVKALHKWLHTIQNREYGHSRFRVIEQLLRDLHATYQRKIEGSDL